MPLTVISFSNRVFSADAESVKRKHVFPHMRVNMECDLAADPGNRKTWER